MPRRNSETDAEAACAEQARSMDTMSIQLYTIPTSPDCVQAKKYLEQCGMTYTEHDVSTNIDVLRQMVRLTGRRVVPVIVWEDVVMVGFSRSIMKQLLESVGKGGVAGSRLYGGRSPGYAVRTNHRVGGAAVRRRTAEPGDQSVIYPGVPGQIVPS